MKNKISLFFFFTFFGIITITAQKGTIDGLIKDNESKALENSIDV